MEGAGAAEVQQNAQESAFREQSLAYDAVGMPGGPAGSAVVPAHLSSKPLHNSSTLLEVEPALHMSGLLASQQLLHGAGGLPQQLPCVTSAEQGPCPDVVANQFDPGIVSALKQTGDGTAQ